VDKFLEAVEFQERNYDIIGSWMVRPNDKVMLGGNVPKESRVCRFCKKSHPEVSFSKDAHAVPESLGNKSILSAYECDPCNEKFGQGIENDLGNWSKPMRTLMRIRGKSGVPTLKKGSSGGWRVEYDNTSGLQITAYEDEPIFEIDEAAKSVVFTLRRDPYTPVAVHKALVKIGLTLLPEQEVPNFQHAIQWVCSDDRRPFMRGVPILRAFQPGPMPNDLLVASVFRRKAEVENVLYAFLVLAFGNEMYQVFLPSPERDSRMPSGTVSFTGFPMPSGLVSAYGPPLYESLTLDGSDVIRGEVIRPRMGYGALIETTPLVQGASAPSDGES
jgi:hypothetical protein